MSGLSDEKIRELLAWRLPEEEKPALVTKAEPETLVTGSALVTPPSLNASVTRAKPLLGRYLGGHSTRWAQSLYEDEAAVETMAVFLGLAQEQLIWTERGARFLEGRSERSLGDEYARRFGVVRLSGKGELAWRARLALDSGVVEPVEVRAAELPQEALPLTGRVWTGFLHFVRVRWSYSDSPGEGVPFSRSFAAGWCRETPANVRIAWDDLKRRQFVLEAGSYQSPKSRPITLWLPRQAS